DDFVEVRLFRQHRAVYFGRFMISEKWGRLFGVQPIGQDSSLFRYTFQGFRFNLDGDYFRAYVGATACVVGLIVPRNGDIPEAEGRKDTPLDVFYSHPRDVFRRYSIEIEHQNLLPGPRWYSIAWSIIAREIRFISASSRM